MPFLRRRRYRRPPRPLGRAPQLPSPILGDPGMRDVERRRRQRARRQLTCEVVVGGRRYPAIVRDASPSGVFVQTRAKPRVDSVVNLVFRACEWRPEIRVEAGVARERIVAPRLRSTVPEGLGLELLDPPAAFRELLDSAGRDPEPGHANDERSHRGIRTFRIRLIRRDTSDWRVMTVRSESAAGARARALARVGPAWKIADLQEI